MSGDLVINKIQLGDSGTAANNFVIEVPVIPDGTLKISRGNIGATTQDVLTVDASGNVVLVGGFSTGLTWQDFVASRAVNTTYTNNTASDIDVTASVRTSSAADLEFLVDGVSIAKTTLTAASVDGIVSAVVPAGSTYRVNCGGTVSLQRWWEKR